MTPKKIRTVAMPRSQAHNYLRKAEQFLYAMQLCSVDGEWDAAVLNGVHAAISITDALLIQRSGIHSISQRHDDAIILLQQHYSKEELAGNDHRFAKILTQKHMVSYQPDLVRPNKAAELVKEVERYFQWAKKVLR